jgi:putative toxin-antitoxin system antitoxin component (TIGR02293 family)
MSEKVKNGNILSEPLPVYGFTGINFILHKKSYDSSIALNFNDIDLINLAREGVKKDSLKSLNNYLGITMEQMATLLGTTYRNLHRKDANEILDNSKTEKAIELATFARRGVQVIGSEEGFKSWLQSPIKSLSNKKPLDYLDTTFGIQMVLKILGRLEQGVFS